MSSLAAQHAIPTLYRETQFRSRLEARWAAWFDLVKWPWVYEPLDLPGYIPDFALVFASRPALLVEIKPALTVEELRESAQKTKRAMIAAGRTEEFLLFGVSPGVCLLGERVESPDGPDWWLEPGLVFRCRDCGVSICSTIGSYKCRRCGIHDGDHHISEVLFDTAGWSESFGTRERTWEQAGTITQWRAPV